MCVDIVFVNSRFLTCTLILFFWQALREDVRRQTDREHQLQTRYSHLLYERDAAYNHMQNPR